MTLLFHYYQPDTDPVVVRMAAADWLDVLGAFPQGVIDQACREWMREGTGALGESPAKHRRPAPGEIRALVGKHLAAQHVALPPPPPEPEPPREVVSPERKAEIMREVGVPREWLVGLLPGCLGEEAQP